MNHVAEKPGTTSFKAGWNVFRHELLFVVWALMEVALIAPLFMAMTPWTTFWSPAMVTIWLLLIMLIPFNMSRLTSVLGVSLARQQLIMVVSLALVLLLAWRTLLYTPSTLTDFGWLAGIFSHIGDSSTPLWSRELAIFVIVALMWWRGIALAGRGVDYRDVGLRMRSGVLLAVFFVAGLAGSQLTWSVTPFILLFFFASLVAIVLTRVEQLELSRGGRSFPIGPSWLLIIVLVAGAVAFFTGVIAGFASGESVGGVVGFFEPLWLALRFALAPIVMIVSLLGSPILIVLVALVNWIFSFLGPALGEGLDNLQITIETFPSEAPEQIVESTELITRDYRQLLTGLTMLLVILLVGLALGRLYRLARPATEIESASVSPLESLGLPGRSGLGRRLLDRLNVFRRWQAAASIRHVYRVMCAAAAEKGYPRSRSETPYEYLAALAKAWPDQQAETVLITEAYNKAHYGELPENEAELQLITDAWSRLASESGGPTSAEPTG